MLNQARKESSIDMAEKRIASLTNTAQSIRNNFEQLRVDMRSDYQVQQIEQDLRAVFELTGNYRAEEQELAYRQIQLQKARDVFIKELTNYDAFMATKIDKIGQMNEQFQGKNYWVSS
jgi:ribosomal protein S15P/S13E